ncbi:MAG: tRNA (N(6)-L-threonylcarbamoyladenosine(37)-C(2))-methylthiotransferase MtaB, partial [Chlamydiia bacterium]|nr:tRNA (N(6)-L-threonylcarbamoyladenosine(37)-C(2))-methylthiotransferase MtaB [Chlamydiia bacterium]
MVSKKFKITALGCRTNQYEAQAFTDQLLALGYEAAAEGEPADLCIVNTCTVTASADSSSRHEIRKLASDNPHAPIYVTGCYAERDPKAVKDLPNVAGVIPNQDKEALIKALFPDAESLPEFNIERFEAHTRAFVKVQDGCNSFCTYCIIPYVRGRSRSREASDIIQEVERLVSNGFKEIVLTGINIGDFDGGAVKSNLAELTRLVDAVEGVERVRISSIDPDEVDDDLLDAVVNGKKTCQSMHIVLQSGSNVVLKRMNRKYTRQMFLETCERLRTASPDFTFTTDVIVGFPGETEEDHKETLKILEEVRFAKVHMFPYSDRPRTRASLYPNKVDNGAKARRKQEV